MAGNVHLTKFEYKYGILLPSIQRRYLPAIFDERAETPLAVIKTAKTTKYFISLNFYTHRLGLEYFMQTKLCIWPDRRINKSFGSHFGIHRIRPPKWMWIRTVVFCAWVCVYFYSPRSEFMCFLIRNENVLQFKLVYNRCNICSLFLLPKPKGKRIFSHIFYIRSTFSFRE